MPGIKIRKEDQEKIHSKFLCTSCHYLLLNPVQTMCGHLFCQSCMDILLRSPDAKCPEDQEKLNKNNVFPDAFTKRELKSIRLHCPSEQCEWFGSYEELERHYQVCEHALISCVHKQCNIQLPRSLLGEHLKNDCEYRNVKCEYCGKDVPYALLKDHMEKLCEYYPVSCQYCKKKIPRKDVENHENTTCDEVPTKCEFQAIGCNHDKTLKRREIRQHMNDHLIDHVSALLRYVMAFVTQLSNYVPRPEFTTAVQNMADQVTAVRANLSEKFVMLVGKLTGLERRIESLEARGDNDSNNANSSLEVSSMRDRISTLERQLRENSSTILRFRERLDQINESLARNTVKITDLEARRGARALGSNQAIHSYNGTLLWKIDNFSKKRQDAINGIKTALYSAPFYSSQYGYKMCAKIYMNGDGFGKETHLSLFFVVMKGDYDALQTWPFQKKITMMLMDQGNGDHMIDAFHSDPQSSSFQRPKSDMNIASGSPLFMPLESLKNRQYVKDDTLFIKMIVD
ncbi:TNF receptor-associated factor 3-like [Xenia sp. Carnegie-2017]|uniref:TNF receptor-associated factor 3-like n=1 Tax=Xenia sp. Carnegie-2017 TaxID=2897299 RepID=UPI001F0447FF|nr:TNF receptor-associated factor 3-like [Xenia sp. Carnegie-2017]XP_046855633.1 TNF receptor-associated factor 3-like [Xenia sp. Carnegie-2017]XP_046855634.1 TNF receptor-associated factor 3-like [Xenia sp. Carnegie-2017]XP_046855635.1 TNF receptor-associated factor 3-like [Xenia sp. Carnegie-2017]